MNVSLMPHGEVAKQSNTDRESADSHSSVIFANLWLV